MAQLFYFDCSSCNSQYRIPEGRDRMMSGYIDNYTCTNCNHLAYYKVSDENLTFYEPSHCEHCRSEGTLKLRSPDDRSCPKPDCAGHLVKNENIRIFGD